MTHFKALTNPRVERARSYSLEAILLQTIAAVVSDADTWVAIEESGKAKRSWSGSMLSCQTGHPHTTRSGACPRDRALPNSDRPS